jgi:hypothetical protein
MKFTPTAQEADQDLAGARGGGGDLVHLEDFGAAELMDPNRAHRLLPPREDEPPRWAPLRARRGKRAPNGL